MTPLHQFGEFVRQALATIPLPAARALFIALLVAVLIWTLLLPREATTPTGHSGRLTENLKLWAAVALLIQLAIYTLV